MKKPIIFLLLLSLTASLCGCRPATLSEGKDGKLPVKTTTSKTTETFEQERSKAASSAGQTGDKTAVEQTETKSDSKSEQTDTDKDAVKYFVETKDGVEWKVPEEDPKLRAEAEKILKEKGEWDCFQFCDEHDITFYRCYTAEQTDLDPTMIHVWLKRCCSEEGKVLPPFEKYLGPVAIKDILAPTEHTPPQTEEQRAKYKNLYELTLPEGTTVVQAIEAVKKLEALPYVQRATLFFVNDVGYAGV